MARTKIDLDEQAVGRVFTYGSTAVNEQALVTIEKGTAATSTVVLDVKGSASFGGDVVIGGNFTYNGTINNQSVTNLDVTDLVIRMNNGGATPADNTSGIVVEGTTDTIASAMYFNSTSTTKWSYAVGGDAVGTTATQTLTNKSISGGQITSAVANATLAASVTTNANLTGVITSVGNTTSIGAQTGTGSTFVVQTSPTLITPNIGAATGTSLSTSGAQSVGTSSSVNGEMTFRNATNAFTQTFRGSGTAANITYVLPVTAPTAGQVLTSTAPATNVATLSWSDSGAASTINVSDDTTTNAVVYPVWVSGTTGSQSAKVTSTKISFNPSTGVLTATQFTGSGAGLTGTASSLTAGSVTTIPNLTGDVTSVGNATTLAKYFRAAVVSGTQDSSNKVFTIGAAVKTGSEQVFHNGQLLTPGVSNDYVISGTTITFQANFTAPKATATIRVYGVY